MRILWTCRPRGNAVLSSEFSPSSLPILSLRLDSFVSRRGTPVEILSDVNNYPGEAADARVRVVPLSGIFILIVDLGTAVRNILDIWGGGNWSFGKDQSDQAAMCVSIPFILIKDLGNDGNILSISFDCLYLYLFENEYLDQ